MLLLQWHPSLHPRRQDPASHLPEECGVVVGQCVTMLPATVQCYSGSPYTKLYRVATALQQTLGRKYSHIYEADG